MPFFQLEYAILKGHQIREPHVNDFAGAGCMKKEDLLLKEDTEDNEHSTARKRGLRYLTSSPASVRSRFELEETNASHVMSTSSFIETVTFLVFKSSCSLRP